MPTRPQPPCPECEKLSAVSDKSNEIGDFLSWLVYERDPQLVLAEYVSETRLHEVAFTNALANKLLSEYYEIDLDKVEQERRALLEWVREQYEQGDQ